MLTSSKLSNIFSFQTFASSVYRLWTTDWKAWRWYSCFRFCVVMWLSYMTVVNSTFIHERNCIFRRHFKSRNQAYSFKRYVFARSFIFVCTFIWWHHFWLLRIRRNVTVRVMTLGTNFFLFSLIWISTLLLFSRRLLSIDFLMLFHTKVINSLHIMNLYLISTDHRTDNKILIRFKADELSTCIHFV